MMEKEKKGEERKLTAAEQRRKEHFEELKAGLERDGYTARNLTISVVRANVLAIVLMLPFVILFLFWYVCVNDTLGEKLSQLQFLLMPVLLIVLMVAHELIHGLVWGCFADSGFKAIEFGMIWSALTPYCTCTKPLKRWQYILGSVMPTIVLGFGLGIVAIYTKQNLLCYLSLLMILGGGGDFCIIIKLLRHRFKGEKIYCDHPYECGLVVFERDKRVK